MHSRRRTFSAARLLCVLVLATALPATLPSTLPAQDLQPLTIDDYSKWRTIDGARISGDGRWVAYTLRFTNVLEDDEDPVLHIRDLQTDREIEVPNAHSGEFSRDSRWIVYEVDEVKAERGRGGEDADSAAADSAARPTASPQRYELRELATGQTRSWERIQSASFNNSSSHLLLRRRAASNGRGGNGGNGGNGAAARGADYVLHDLAGGRSLFLGAVGDIAFNRQGDLLAYAVQSEPRDGNGLFMVDLGRNRTQVLENDTLIYSRLEWSDDGNRIAALKGRPVKEMRERDNRLVTFAALRSAFDRGPGAPAVLDTTADGFPSGFVITERAPLAWSDDARRVFFGIMPQRPAPDTAKAPATDSVPNVDVWHWQDDRVQSVQMVSASQDLNRTFTQAFDIAGERFIALADSSMREIELAPTGHWAVGMNPVPYVADTAFPRADIYRVDTRSGERTLMMRGQLVGQHEFGITPDGSRFLYWDDDRYQAYDFAAGTSRTLPGGENGEFLDMEWDYVGPRPAYGVEGIAADGSGVIVRERYDLVFLPFGRGEARELTGGTGDSREIVFRHVRTEPIPPTAPRRVRTGREIDLSRPLTLSAYGQWTKKDGFYRLSRGRLEELVYEDARFSNPSRAENADRLLFTRETFREFPDLQIANLDFDRMRKISDANPQQSEYIWGRSELFDYQTDDGVRLQGVLMIPDTYVEGERWPMLVTFYEKNSQNLNRYLAPSYLSSMGRLTPEALSRGYLMMLADVHFHTGRSHSDVLESVEAATRKVIEMGYADPESIGAHGHSYGGEAAAFIGVRSDMFAAVGMGAGVTDIEADFNQSWGWSYQLNEGIGAPGSDYYLFGQGRWGTDPWRDPELYRYESAISHADEAKAPFLIMHGTADAVVGFPEGMNFYQALRYNNKPAWMLAYPGEGHGLRALANRRDLTTRYFDFFGHFLKGEPAPTWMTSGVPYLVKERQRRSGGR